MSQVAIKMGWHGFDYQYAGDVFNEHVALTAYKNSHCAQDMIGANANGHPRYLNIAKSLRELSDQSALDTHSVNPPLSQQHYDELPPLQWGKSHIDMIDDDYKHHTLRFIAVKPPTNAGDMNTYHASKMTHNFKPSNQGLKLRLITGRLRDQWHTMTRTALAPVLNQQQSEPTVTVSHSDAKKLGLLDKDLKLKDNAYLKLNSSIPVPNISEDISTNAKPPISVIANVQVNEDMREGDTFMSIHWSDAFASMACVGALVPTQTDPISGQPELKNSAVYAESVPIHSVAKIMVHAEMQDAVVSQLRTLISDSTYLDSTCDGSSCVAQSPNLLYSLSRQQNSVLISIAIPSIKLATAWTSGDF